MGLWNKIAQKEALSVPTYFFNRLIRDSTIYIRIVLFLGPFVEQLDFIDLIRTRLYLDTSSHLYNRSCLSIGWMPNNSSS